MPLQGIASLEKHRPQAVSYARRIARERAPTRATHRLRVGFRDGARAWSREVCVWVAECMRFRTFP